MLKNRKALLMVIIAILLVLVVCVVGCGPGEQPEVTGDSGADKPVEVINIAAVPAGPGVWYLLAESLTKSINDSSLPYRGGEVLPGGGVSNVIQVSEGNVTFGVTGADTTVSAIKGDIPFERSYTDVGQVLNLFPSYFQAVVRADSGINSFRDLPGNSINVLSINSSSELFSRQVFELYDLTYDDLSRTEHIWFDAAYDLIRDGRLDGSFSLAPLPHPFTVDLALARDIKLLSLEDDIIKKILAINSGYMQDIIPGGIYKGIDDEVITVSTPTVLIANLNVSEELVYDMTKLFVEEWEKISAVHPLLSAISPADLAKEAGFPHHPGAARYFREVGYLD